MQVNVYFNGPNFDSYAYLKYIIVILMFLRELKQIYFLGIRTETFNQIKIANLIEQS